MVRFISITVQFALIVLVIREFGIVSPNFGNLMVLAWGGFLVQHFLPRSFRLPWFVLLSLASLALVAQNRVALCVAGCGVVLIGICHLPIRFWWRVTLLAAAAAGVAYLSIYPVNLPVNPAAWSILGAMFMFRMMSYLYELKHNTAPFSVMQSLAYFFMLPNICFLFFPLVDYRTFCTTYYNDEPERIYSTGINWMLRGIVHLLLYRLIYQLSPFDPYAMTDLLSVAWYLLSTYLLYLQVSGWFHLIVGLLHMFGFNLPETHHLYLLASSFTDFWRRINIYWKDFLLKVFFYPAYFRLKSLGPKWAMSLATLFAFFVTWLLHSYQFFWIRGAWLITWQDSLFWAILAGLVLANALWELRSGGGRLGTRAARTWKSDLQTAAGTIGTFVTICCLWTFWSSKTWSEVTWLASAATNAPWQQVSIVAAFLLAIGGLGVLFGQRSTERAAAPATGTKKSWSWQQGALVSAGCCLLLAIGALPAESTGYPSWVSNTLTAIKADGLNRFDLAAKRRGYYEELDAARADTSKAFLRSRNPGDHSGHDLQVKTQDFILWRPKPNAKSRFSGGTVTINRWGLRDRDMDKEKAPGVFRIAMFGSSHEYGMGLSDGLTFDVLLEDQLNRDAASNGDAQRYEILNFAYQGYSVLQRLYCFETQSLEFHPDAAFFVVNANEDINLLPHLSMVLSAGYACPYSIVNELTREEQINSNMPRQAMETRLSRHVERITDWTIERFVGVCRSKGIAPCVVFRPGPTAISGFEHTLEAKFVEHLTKLSIRLGVHLFDLTNAYQGSHSASIVVSLADDHTNQLGHKLLADELFKLMRAPAARPAWRGNASQISPQTTSGASYGR